MIIDYQEHQNMMKTAMTVLMAGLAMLSSQLVFAAKTTEKFSASYGNCHFQLPAAFAELSLTNPASAQQQQIMYTDNIVFTDTTPGSSFEWNYQSVINSLDNCGVTTKHIEQADGYQSLEINIQGKAKTEALARTLGANNFRQNNLYIFRGKLASALEEYFFVGDSEQVAKQIQDRDASLQLKNTQVQSGLIYWSISKRQSDVE